MNVFGLPGQPMSVTPDVPVVTEVLAPNAVRYAADRGPRPDLMAASLRNLRHAVDQCQDAIFTCDPAGVIERVNPAFEKITGYSSLETIGKDLSWIAAEGPRSDSYRRIWEQVFQERTYRGSLQVR
jgi:PAS domain-containing protein